MTQTLADTHPRLAEHGKSMQHWDLDHEGYKVAVSGAITFPKGHQDDPAGHAPNTNDWKHRADEGAAAAAAVHLYHRPRLAVKKQSTQTVDAVCLRTYAGSGTRLSARASPSYRAHRRRSCPSAYCC